MAEFKVFIPSAGLGSRVSTVNPRFNKAMLEIANKPVISHIIEKFDPSVPVVVAIGYQGDLLRQFLTLAYPDRDIECVEIDPYEGPDSGLGITLRQCRHLLNCPFIFISNDTIILDEIPSFSKMPDNWLGYAKVDDASEYRTVQIADNGQVLTLNEKNINPKQPAYIGVAGIKWYEAFWQCMQDEQAVSQGESYAIHRMIADKFKFTGFQFDWIDTGSVAGIEQAKARVEGQEFNILEKPTESIWFVEDKVIKYSDDTEFISNRVKRMEILGKFVPEFLDTTDNMYSYKFVEGKIFSEINSIQQFKYLLNFLGRFWTDGYQTDTDFYKFYIDKTIDRICQYQWDFKQHEPEVEIINGKPYGSVLHMVRDINLDDYKPPYIVRFHGDLHFENILLRDDLDGLPIVFLDWRQDFQGNLEYGDAYYDFAKLMHGMQVSHELIAKENFSVERSGVEVQFSYYRKSHYIEYEKIFIEWLTAHHFDVKKVKLFNALIFLNIAALHHYPYSHFLYYLGKSMLGDLLDDNLRDTV